MINRLNVPTGIALCLAASIPAWGLAQSPHASPAPASIQIPVTIPPPPPEVIPEGISAGVWHHALAAHRAEYADHAAWWQARRDGIAQALSGLDAELGLS